MAREIEFDPDKEVKNMDTVKVTIKTGQKPTKEQLQEIREAAKRPINLDDMPELTPAQLAEFKPVDGMTWEQRAELMAAKRTERKRQPVTIRLVPDCITAYKALGKGYTGIMADVLTYAIHNPDILTRAIQ